MNTYKKFIGIDVSKDTLDLCYHSSQESYFEQFANTSSQITKWINTLDKGSTLCILEPTGAYSSRLIFYLNKQQIPFCLVNPIQSDGFTKARGIISKNDRQAAYALALMGKTLDLPLYKYPEESLQKRKQILAALNALKKQQQMLKNQLHALDHQIIFEPKVIEALRASLKTVEEQIQPLEEALNELSDDEYEKQIQLMQSVIGIGPKTANLLIAATGGIQNFKKPKQLSKFIGLIPSSHYSGSSVYKKGRITRRGNASLRASLYMAARSAKRHNFSCKSLYERLRQKGKPHKQAMVAVMNKLIKQVFGVVNSGVSFDNQFYLKFCKT